MYPTAFVFYKLIYDLVKLYSLSQMLSLSSDGVISVGAYAATVVASIRLFRVKVMSRSSMASISLI